MLFPINCAAKFMINAKISAILLELVGRLCSSWLLWHYCLMPWHDKCLSSYYWSLHIAYYYCCCYLFWFAAPSFPCYLFCYRMLLHFYITFLFSNVFQKFSSQLKVFWKKICGSFGISLPTCTSACGGMSNYIWISSGPVKAGPTLGVIVAIDYSILNKTMLVLVSLAYFIITLHLCLFSLWLSFL